MSRAAAIASAGMLVAACSKGDHYLIVTVASRPSVRGATQLVVSESNAAASRTDTLALASHAFPVTFSIDAPGRTGELDLSIEAHDATDQVVGVGTAATTVDASTAEVMLESVDFVVNTEYAGDQYLSEDYEAMGLQLAVASDDSWTVGFRDGCPTGVCSMFGRRFDATGAPVSTVLAAGTNQFVVSTNSTTFASTPAVAASGTNALVFWDAYDMTGTVHGVSCRAIDALGNGLPNDVTIASDSPDVVSATRLSNDNIAVSWQIGAPPTQSIRTIVARPDCTTLTASPVTVSTVAGQNQGPGHSQIASNGASVLYAWVTDYDAHVRATTNAATFGMADPDTTVIAHTASLQVTAVRVAPLGAGFALAVRWAQTSGSGPGKIELYRLSATGAKQGTPTLVTDQSQSDFTSGNQTFGIASRADGALLVAWHQCDAMGTTGTCDVLGRVFRPTGAPVGDPFQLPTTTLLDQTGPSVAALSDAFVAAWTDASHTAPDADGTAVRARVIYPPFDDATAIAGAPCGTGLPACNTGLVCAMGSDGERCYAACDPTGPQPQCPAGGSCAAAGACTF